MDQGEPNPQNAQKEANRQLQSLEGKSGVLTFHNWKCQVEFPSLIFPFVLVPQDSRRRYRTSETELQEHALP